ncbi:TetR/AcrR family transcriptional regulator [Actinomadura nitritigenes]|uniref:TetR/AcrR family transcriptional regulator n=1 Tax=Actinomadura nitritigenes TaxID=134602 RepID=UPI003D9449B8
MFLERGFENVTVTDITERPGLTRGTFFRYFTDKSLAGQPRRLLWPRCSPVSA